MLIKYRSKVVHSATNVRRLKQIGKVVGRPLVHTRQTFTFKRPLSKWPSTIYDNQSLQMMNGTEKTYRHFSNPIHIYACQCWGFFLLYLIGFALGALYTVGYHVKYESYFFTHDRLIELQLLLTNGCYTFTDLPCSLQMKINVYFLRIKFLLVYYSLIVISMIYTWHRTVSLLYCAIAMFIIIVISFGTNLILYSQNIVRISSLTCNALVTLFVSLEGLMPYGVDDPLHVFCERITYRNNRNNFSLDGQSRCTRFYHWVKAMKKQWNVKEDKLIITFIASVIGIVLGIIVGSYG